MLPHQNVITLKEVPVNLRSAPREGGAAVVEFALIAVLLLTLMVGVIEGGRLFVMQANLAQAAREGAREIAINGATGPGLTRADQAFSFGTPTAVALVGCASPPAPGSNARVELSYSPGMLTGLIPITPTLSAEGVMRCGG